MLKLVFQNMTPCIWVGRHQILFPPYTVFLGLTYQNRKCHILQEFNLTIYSLDCVKYCAV